MNLGVRSKTRLTMLLMRLLSLDPLEEGGPLRYREPGDHFGDIECQLCGTTWHGIGTVEHIHHFDHCPVDIARRLDRELRTQDEAVRV